MNFKNLISRILDKMTNKNKNLKDFHIIKLQLAKIMINIQKNIKSKNINDYEFKVFSQFGEDGIINFLIDKLNIKNNFFIEFGVEDYEEANTRLLLENKNWSGLIFDSSEKNIKIIKKKDYYWKYNLVAQKSFITKKNINSLIKSHVGNKKVGLLSIDIDGNDYWIWKTINCIQPDIVIIEYNARLGYKNSLSIPYKEDFERKKENHSMIYFGCSLEALRRLGVEKGYSLVGTNKNGNNAFFVRKEIIKKSKNTLKSLNSKDSFNINTFNELRNKKGNLLERSSSKEKEIINNSKFVKV